MNIWNKYGVYGFYRSYFTNLLTIVPTQAIFFGVYEASSRILGDHDSPLVMHLISGGIAGAMAATVSTPLDTIKTRFQVMDQVSFTNILESSSRRGLPFLFRGLSARVMTMTPLAAINFVIFEVAKKLSKKE